MNIISEIFAAIGSFVLATIGYLGYFGIFVLMILESMVVPVPSEFVMPFAGFLVAQGKFSFAFVILSSTMGSLVGSILSYYIGKKAGHKLIESYGKYVFVDTADLEKIEKWFSRRGPITVFISRLLPAVRHLISLVAGVGKMDVKKFIVYTILGAVIWNSFLAYVGFILGQNWEEVSQYTDILSIIIVIGLIVGFCYYVYRHLKERRKKQVLGK